MFIWSFFLLIAAPVFAASVDLGLAPIADTGLGTRDLRITVANIIRVFLGLLGTIGIVLVLVGGFTWMTAAGNEEKIAKAKKILLNAAVGLVIVLVAYSIVTFVANRLLEATGARSGIVDTGSGDSSGGGIGGTSFLVRQIQPQGTQTIRNLEVRVIFNAPVGETSVADHVILRQVGTDAVIAGALATSGTTVTFTPTAPCPPPNADRRCFDGDTDFSVEVIGGQNGIRSADGRALLCGVAGSCRGTFKTGTLVDTQPPSVLITDPTNGGFVSADALIPIAFTAGDDAGLSSVAVTADGVSVGTAYPPVGNSPTTWSGTVTWDTAGIAPGTSRVLTARARDVDSNANDGAPISVTVRAPHCFNRLQDVNETGPDCGGPDCGVCGGGSCANGSQCASGACGGGQCVVFPTITRFSPESGATGTFVTIIGTGFGSQPGAQGQVLFLGGAGDADDKVASLPSVCRPEQQWNDTAIIVEVPTDVVVGPIKVTGSSGFWDDTTNTRGVVATFQPSPATTPGLCGVAPREEAPGRPVTLSGVRFGAVLGEITIGGARATGTLQWSASRVAGAVIPSTAAVGTADVLLKQGTATSNPVPMTVRAPVGVPRIDAIEPSSGPVGTYVTIRGENFGNTIGLVHFVDPNNGDAVVADLQFPRACSDRVWSATSIVAKVPSQISDIGSYNIRVTANALPSNTEPFTVNRAPLAPGLCLFDPDNGPIGTSTVAAGERFGSAQGNVRFSGDAAGVIARWENERVSLDVPPRATSGRAYVVDAQGTRSNALAFTIRDCRAGIRCPSETPECCSDGSCQARGSCAGAAPACTYGWRFSTGSSNGTVPIGGACGDGQQCVLGARCENNVCVPTIPTVVEQQSCTTTTQSPSPFRATIDGCTGAKLGVRFTMDMDDDSLENLRNVRVVSCGSGARFDDDACGEEAITIEAVNIFPQTTGEGVQWTLRDALAPSTWYRVTLEGDAGGLAARDQRGNLVLLDGDRNGQAGRDYTWFFRTGTGACTVDRVIVSPATATIDSPTGSADFGAAAVSANCNILNVTTPWSWSSRDTGKATVAPVEADGPLAIATPVAETGATPVRIVATNAGTPGDGALTIFYPPPRIIAQWPTCGAACTNAEIGARFSAAIDPGTLLARGPLGERTLLLYRCRTTNQNAVAQAEELRGSSQALEGVARRARDAATNLTSTLRVVVAGGREATRPDRDERRAATETANAIRDLRSAVGDAVDGLSRLIDALGVHATPADHDRLRAANDRARSVAEIVRSVESVPETREGLRTLATVAVESAAIVDALRAILTAAITERGTGTLCGNDVLEGPIDIQSLLYNRTTKNLRLFPAPNTLEPQRTYRVLVRAGSGGVKGENGKALDLGAPDNPLRFSVGRTSYASWTFATKSAPGACAIDRIEIDPANEVEVFRIGATAAYSSVAFGVPDACVATGQRLDPFAYPWAWSTGNATIATVRPRTGGLVTDPEQDAIAEGQGATTVTTSTPGQTPADGRLRLTCGFQNDAQCIARNENDHTLTVGTNGCCVRRPTVVRTNPLHNATNVCRNVVVQVVFSESLDPTSIPGNITLEYETGGGVLVARNVEDTPNGTIVRLTPTTPLLQSTYLLRIRGALAGRPVSETIRSTSGASLFGEPVIRFSTAATLCAIRDVRIEMNPVPVVVGRDVFSCGRRNDCSGDASTADGNQHTYTTRAFDSTRPDAQEVTGTTTWVEEGDSIFSRSGNGSVATLTSNAQNGNATVTATITGATPAEGSASRTIQVNAFMCENPWPAFGREFPWREQSGYQFSLQYCRDAGALGTDDDLPAPAPAAPVRVQQPAGGVRLEYLIPLAP